jgi:hypothetical protein
LHRPADSHLVVARLRRAAFARGFAVAGFSVRDFSAF